MAGISNFQIEDAIKRIGDKDLLDNLVGVFPSNHMNKFINHSEMIKEKKRNTHLSLRTQMTAVKKAHIVEYFEHRTKK